MTLNPIFRPDPESPTGPRSRTIGVEKEELGVIGEEGEEKEEKEKEKMEEKEEREEVEGEAKDGKKDVANKQT